MYVRIDGDPAVHWNRGVRMELGFLNTRSYRSSIAE